MKGFDLMEFCRELLKCSESEENTLASDQLEGYGSGEMSDIIDKFQAVLHHYLDQLEKKDAARGIERSLSPEESAELVEGMKRFWNWEG